MTSPVMIGFYNERAAAKTIFFTTKKGKTNGKKTLYL